MKKLMLTIKTHRFLDDINVEPAFDFIGYIYYNVYDKEYDLYMGYVACGELAEFLEW